MDDVFRSHRGPGTAWGAVDTAFALLSLALLVVACVGAVYGIAPGWSQLPILAVLYLLVRIMLRHLFELKHA